MRIGQYTLDRRLRKGAMGTVYEGFDYGRNERVAIKTMDRSLIDAAEVDEMANRFDREAQVVGKLRHPNIISVYDYGEADNLAYLVMEFIDGDDLADYWHRLPGHRAEDAAGILLQVLDALEYAHAHGVVHRDVKPENILVTREGKVKLGDFGIARIDASELTLPGTVYGTPFYMAPEQFSQPADARCDVYAAGVILYELLTGVKPVGGDSLPDIVFNATNKIPAAPSALNPTVPAVYDQVVLKALAKKPSQRYQSAQAFREALLTALASAVSGSARPENSPGL